ASYAEHAPCLISADRLDRIIGHRAAPSDCHSTINLALRSRRVAGGCAESGHELVSVNREGYLFQQTARFDVNQLATLPTSGTKTEYEAKDQPGETAPRSARGGGTSGLT